MTNTQDAGKGIVPSDLALVAQPDINKDYFNVTVKDLKINKTYAVQFQWVELDGKLGPWSPGFIFTTSHETAPAVPTSVTVPSTGSGSIPVTLSVFPTNAKRVDVIITGGVFGTATIAHSFSAAGTTTIAAPAGTYIVQLRSISPTGVTSTVGTTFTITISSADIVVLPSTTPSTPTVSSTLGAIQLAWNGKTSSGADQPSGFVAAKVYVGTSSGFTPVDTGLAGANQVDVLNFANGQNTLNIAVGTLVNNVAMDYGIDYFIKIKTTNGNAAQDSAAVLATGSPARIGQVGNGDIVEITADKIKTGTISTQTITVGAAGGKRVELRGSGNSFEIFGTGGTSLLSYNAAGNKLSVTGEGTFTGNITGANGTFSGDLSSSNGQFSVVSGNMSALSGNIGNWQINQNALKSSTLAFPSIQLDPVGSKIELRGSPGASDTGNYIKMDTTTGLRIGSISTPAFTVAMDGSMTAKKANFQNEVGGNTIILDNTSFRMSGSSGTTTLDYSSNITLSSPGNVFNNSGSRISLINDDTSTELWPGGIKFFQGPIFGSAAVSVNQYLYNNQLVTYATGLSEITWANFYINSAPPYNYPTAQVWTRFGDDFRPLGITPFGGQLLGPRLFSGTATSNSTINSDINSRSIASASINGDFYFSTA
jgi:hypothetical protein